MAENARRDIKAAQVRILGRVQRVGFRYWTINEASCRGLDGWIKNRVDGSVEAVFVGPLREVDDMLAVCADGPPSAIVNSVVESEVHEDEWCALVGQGFSARRTE
ncbi:MAG: acylphosphatase [Alphaproteobacteria bacterium]|nr:acylphosphatase [Alphaproteobacteria bacterium]